MEISNQDKKLMISTLGTLRFNSYNDLVQNIKKFVAQIFIFQYTIRKFNKNKS